MILIGIGANLASETYGPPRATCGAALEMLEDLGLRLTARAPWYRSAPVPVSDQPWYVNGVVAVETDLAPDDLMGKLLDVERRLGRRRSVRNAPRTVDLDVIAYNDRISAGPAGVILPHPRMHERAFVLKPLADICPNWRHPASDATIDQLLARLPPEQTTERMADAVGLHGTEWGQTGSPP